MRRTAGAAAALLLAGCGTATTTSTATSSEPDTEEGGSWMRAAEVPLSARTWPLVAWTGTEVLVAGGNEGFVCPPNADCVIPDPDDLARDGAAYEPVTGTWRPIAAAPVGLQDVGGASHAYVAGRLVFLDWSADTWLAYDPLADAWATLRSPGKAFSNRLSHDGARFWALDGSRILAWDPATGETTVERTYRPADPMDDAWVIPTDLGPVVVGTDHDVPADEPSLALVDVPVEGGWQRHETGQLGWFSHWSGTRIVGYEPGGADGGEVDGWDRWYPFGGTFDPATGAWSPVAVPEAAWDGSDTGWRVSAYSRALTVTGGWFVDDRVGRWHPLGRPGSDLDSDLAATWAGDRLFVLGGVDDAVGYERPAGPEAWLWTPPPG